VETFSLGATKSAPYRLLELHERLAVGAPDVIIAHLFHAYTTARIFGRLFRRIPVISVFHSTDQPPVRCAIDRATRGLTEYFVTVSEDGAAFAREKLGIPKRKLRVIYNGVNVEAMESPSVPREVTRKSFGFAEGDFVIGCVARLHPVKDHETLLRAFQILRKRGRENAKFLLVGDGGDAQKLRALAEQLHLLGDVIFAGFRTDLPDLYAAMDAVCLTSLREGLPTTLLEAMAAGVPIVATDAPGTVSLLRHRENGLLAPMKDADGIASGLETVMAQPELVQALVEAGRREVKEKYSLEQCLRGYQAVIEDIAGKPK
jgi:glycosyltransferase involved in cell wall biosynthesis